MFLPLFKIPINSKIYSKLANEFKDIYKTAVIKVTLVENQCYNQSNTVTYEDIDIEDVVHIKTKNYVG